MHASDASPTKPPVLRDDAIENIFDFTRKVTVFKRASCGPTPNALLILMNVSRRWLRHMYRP